MKKEPLLIAVASQKGGVGKSVFTVLLGKHSINSPFHSKNVILLL